MNDVIVYRLKEIPKQWDDKGNNIFYDEILKIRNITKNSFGNNNEIDKYTHYKFMNKHWYNYYVAMWDGKVVGFGGVVDDDIRVAVDPNHQKKGIAKNIITRIVKDFPQGYATIKADNFASQKLFESCGFKKTWYILEKK